MKRTGTLVVAMLMLAACLVLACGSSNKTASSGNEDAGSGDTAPGVVPGGGMVARNVFMTYDGKRYELVNMLMPGMVPDSEFQPMGEVTQSDVDLSGDTHAYTRAQDPDTVYTHSVATGEDAGHWLAWQLAP